MRTKVKTLPLDYWMLNDWTLNDCLEGGRYEVVTPVFDRPGKYFERLPRGKKKCWFEIEDGRAFTYRADCFEYELSLLNAERLNHRQALALREVIAQRLGTKEQAKMMYHYDANLVLREIHLNGLRGRKRFAKFNKRRGSKDDPH